VIDYFRKPVKGVDYPSSGGAWLNC